MANRDVQFVVLSVLRWNIKLYKFNYFVRAPFYNIDKK